MDRLRSTHRQRAAHAAARLPAQGPRCASWRRAWPPSAARSLRRRWTASRRRCGSRSRCPRARRSPSLRHALLSPPRCTPSCMASCIGLPVLSMCMLRPGHAQRLCLLGRQLGLTLGASPPGAPPGVAHGPARRFGQPGGRRPGRPRPWHTPEPAGARSWRAGGARAATSPSRAAWPRPRTWARAPRSPAGAWAARRSAPPLTRPAQAWVTGVWRSPASRRACRRLHSQELVADGCGQRPRPCRGWPR